MAKGPLQNKIFISLLGAVAFMFFFSFLLVPLYNVFCEVTGINGKFYGGSSEFVEKEKETDSRKINVRFLSTVNGSAPVSFYPSSDKLIVRTDEVNRTTYVATNNTSKEIIISITPSVQPSMVRDEIKKIQCFCFEEQTLGPFETQEWPIRFYVDSDISNNVNNVYLSYTLFEKNRDNPVTMNHE